MSTKLEVTLMSLIACLEQQRWHSLTSVPDGLNVNRTSSSAPAVVVAARRGEHDPLRNLSTEVEVAARVAPCFARCTPAKPDACKKLQLVPISEKMHVTARITPGYFMAANRQAKGVLLPVLLYPIRFMLQARVL